MDGALKPQRAPGSRMITPPSCGKVSRPCHLADRRSPAPSPAGDLRSSRRRGLEIRAEPPACSILDIGQQLIFNRADRSRR